MNLRDFDGIPVHRDDFDGKECARILSGCECPQYSSMRIAFKGASADADQAGDCKQAKISFLLSEACSLMLSPESKDEPFKPFLVSFIEGYRSFAIGDFSNEHLAFLAAIIPDVKDIRLKARLADVVWVRKKDPQYALLAIDFYRKVPLDENTLWVLDGEECWHRALRLAVMLGRRAGNRAGEGGRRCWCRTKLPFDVIIRSTVPWDLPALPRLFPLTTNASP